MSKEKVLIEPEEEIFPRLLTEGEVRTVKRLWRDAEEGQNNQEKWERLLANLDAYYTPSHISLSFCATDPTTLNHVPILILAPIETDLREWRDVLAQLIEHYPDDHEIILEALDAIEALEVHVVGCRVRLAVALRHLTNTHPSSTKTVRC